VLEPTRIAVLDRRTSEVVCRYPEVMTAVVARTVARAHALALSLAVTCITGVKVRLLVLLWHLADRWGKVTPSGVDVPLRLTHETLGKLVGARRPSVSTAIGELQRAGLLDPRRDGWTLHGDAPEEVRQMHDRRRMTRDLETAS
jgi:CRP/FNR family transcriptional regulator, cyclic AMP receptor protein